MSTDTRRLHAVIYVYEDDDDMFTAFVHHGCGCSEQQTFATREACLHDAARELARRFPSRFSTPSNEVP